MKKRKLEIAAAVVFWNSGCCLVIAGFTKEIWDFADNLYKVILSGGDVINLIAIWCSLGWKSGCIRRWL